MSSNAWTKIEHGFFRKAEVLGVAARLSMTRHTAGALIIEFWQWVDGESLDGSLAFPGCTAGEMAAAVDSSVGVPGFCEAMRAVHWLDFESERLVVPRWDRHNSGTAKARSQSSRRVEEHRRRAEIAAAAAQAATPALNPADHSRRNEVAPNEPVSRTVTYAILCDESRTGNNGDRNAESVTNVTPRALLRSESNSESLTQFQSSESISASSQSVDTSSDSSEGCAEPALSSEAEKSRRRPSRRRSSSDSRIPKSEIESRGLPILVAKLHERRIDPAVTPIPWVVSEIGSICRADQMFRRVLATLITTREQLQTLMRVAARALARGADLDRPGAWLRSALRDEGLDV